MAYSDVIEKLGQIKQNNLDLITKQIPPGKGGSPGQPYDPPKPTGPYVPAPKLANSSLDAAGDMGYVTEKGFFLDGAGDAFINTPEGLLNDGEYNIDIHGLIIPLAQKMMINPKVAVGEGVVTPKDFSPPPFRYFPHFRTPFIKDQELKHFNNFIRRADNNSPLLIAKGKKNKKKGLSIYDEAARRDAFRDMGNEPYDPDTGRMGGGFDIMNDVLGLDEA